MEALKAELALKRKSLATEGERPNKYVRRGDIEKMRLEKERREAEEKKKANQLEKTSSTTPETKDPENSKSLPPLPPVDVPVKAESSINLSPEEITQRLRSKGQPIRLFGELERERGLRLRALELIEEKGLERGYGGNDFKKAFEEAELRQHDKEKLVVAKEKRKELVENSGPIDLKLIKTDPEKLFPLIYFALKKALKEWEEFMNERPDDIKRSALGRLAAATQVQSAAYLKPLFKQLKTKTMPPDVLKNIAEIVHYMQTRQYQKANDAYLRLSIGNAPWPIGVTMVGIHERSAREKISTDQVAHVLNDEVSRKYIQSLKRILTFSQIKYPPDDMSQLMG